MNQRAHCVRLENGRDMDSINLRPLAHSHTVSLPATGHSHLNPGLGQTRGAAAAKAASPQIQCIDGCLSSVENSGPGLDLSGWTRQTPNHSSINPQPFLCQARTFIFGRPGSLRLRSKVTTTDSQLTRPRDNHRVLCRASPTPSLHDIAGNPLWRRRPASLVVDPASAPEMLSHCKTARRGGCFGCRLESATRLTT